MIPREIYNYTNEVKKYFSILPMANFTYKNVSRNYYPVDSAIAMRDMRSNSSLQVTVINDRPQGGSADLSSAATIELMQ